MVRSATAMALTATETVRVGECLVDIPLREVRAPHARRPVRITPKAMGVLLTLARNAGKVVGRDTLLAEVWPGTLPTDDVVTQAITQLRKAFGERRGEARYIETIAKSGYRLLAEVEWLDAPEPALPVATVTLPPLAVIDAPEPSPSLPASPVPPAPAAAPARPARGASPGRRALIVAAVVLTALVLILAVLLVRREAEMADLARSLADASQTGRPYRLLTSAPGFEFAPTLSPDAAMVAYAASRPQRRGTAIFVQTTEPTTARALTAPPAGASDRNPAWSPDGRRIAFERRGPGAACSVMVVPASGGEPRKATDCDPRDLVSFSWTPDGQGLLFGSMHAEGVRVGLRVLDLASGAWRAIPYASAARDLDHAPRYSPDGRWIVFARNPQLGDLWRVPAEGGRAEPLTGQRMEIRGWDWLPDGEGLVFGRRIDSGTRLYRFDLRTREVRDLGIDNAQSPVVAGRWLAFVNRRPEFGLFRFERVAPSGREAVGERLFASSGRDAQPAIAPDARQIVFTSDRSGQFALWWADVAARTPPRLLSTVNPDMRRMPEWSWDSRRLLVVGRDGQGRIGLYEVTPATGQVTMLPVPVTDPIQGLYLPQPDRVLVGSGDGAGQVRLTLFDRSRAPWRALATLEDVSLAKVDPLRDRVLFTRLSEDGLWQADLALSPGSVRRIDAEAPARWAFRNWDIARDGRIYYLEQAADCAARLREIGSDAPPPPRCLDRDRLFTTNGFSVSGSGNAIYVPLATEDGSDIAFMPLPPEPPRGVAGWIK